jgi:hypothetical protein
MNAIAAGLSGERTKPNMNKNTHTINPSELLIMG